MAKASSSTTMGCTRATGPKARAAACSPNPPSIDAPPSSHLRRCRRSKSRPGLSDLSEVTVRVDSCCMTAAKANITAADTAHMTDVP